MKVCLLCVVLVVSGCASQKSLDDKTAELDAYRKTCQGDLAAVRSKASADLDAMKSESSKELQACRNDSDVATRQLESMKVMEGQLRDRLQNEIGAKDVEIERLRSKLSVHVLDSILFRTGSAEILPGGLVVLDKVAQVIKEGKETIRVEGHTDDVPIGPELKKKYFSNWELSGARASSVVRYFQFHHDIDPTRMEAVGFSKYRPASTHESNLDRKRNRRVEIVLTPWTPEIRN